MKYRMPTVRHATDDAVRVLVPGDPHLIVEGDYDDKALGAILHWGKIDRAHATYEVDAAPPLAKYPLEIWRTPKDGEKPKCIAVMTEEEAERLKTKYLSPELEAATSSYTIKLANIAKEDVAHIIGVALGSGAHFTITR